MPLKNDAQPAFAWLALDNAAKIYPAAMTKRWTALFRVSMTLTQEVDRDLLQQALEHTLRRIPTFDLRLRKGLFWFYLEPIGVSAKVQSDVRNPCVRMRLKENDGYMFRVRCYQKRIAVEIFHVLTDGTGGLIFLKTLVAEYLRLRYHLCVQYDHTVLDCAQSVQPEEWEDSFLRYARGATQSRSEIKAYHLPVKSAGRDFIRIITAMIPIAKLKEKAKSYDASITEFLCAVLLDALQEIQRTDPHKKKRKALLKVNVPVNLRKFYNSHTLRNFSGYINPSIDPCQGEYSFEEIVKNVRHFMGLYGTEKHMNARMSANVASERNIFVRAIPLALKSAVMNACFYFQGDRLTSTCFSNLGMVVLPEAMQKYVQRVEFLLGPLKHNRIVCACASYQDTMYLNFTSTVRETALQRLVLTRLVKMGIDVKVESNQR